MDSIGLFLLVTLNLLQLGMKMSRKEGTLFAVLIRDKSLNVIFMVRILQKEENATCPTYPC